MNFSTVSISIFALLFLSACGGGRSSNAHLTRPAGPVIGLTVNMTQLSSALRLMPLTNASMARPFFTSGAAAYEYEGSSSYAAGAFSRAYDAFGLVISADKNVCMLNAIQATRDIYDGKIRKLTNSAFTRGYVKGVVEYGVVTRVDYYSCTQVQPVELPPYSVRYYLRASREGDVQTYEYLDRVEFPSDSTHNSESYSLISGSVSGEQWLSKRIQEIEYSQSSDQPGFVGDIVQMSDALLLRSWSGYQEGNVAVELSGSTPGNSDDSYRLGAGIHISVDGSARNRWSESGAEIPTDPGIASKLDGVLSVTEAEVVAIRALRQALVAELPDCTGEAETIDMDSFETALAEQVSACMFDK